MALHNFPD
jgi:hypothetical protein